MKYTWEEKDIKPGQWVTPIDDYTRFTQCITWHCNRGESLTKKDSNTYGICDIATDGLALDIGTKADMVYYLNRNNYGAIDKSHIIRTPSGPQLDYRANQ